MLPLLQFLSWPERIWQPRRRGSGSRWWQEPPAWRWRRRYSSVVGKYGPPTCSPMHLMTLLPFSHSFSICCPVLKKNSQAENKEFWRCLQKVGREKVKYRCIGINKYSKYLFRHNSINGPYSRLGVHKATHTHAHRGKVWVHNRSGN